MTNVYLNYYLNQGTPYIKWYRPLLNLFSYPEHRIPSIQKRSAEGILPDNIISPDSNTEHTPSRSDNSPYSENLRNKLRRIAVEDGKENRPPGNRVYIVLCIALYIVYIVHVIVCFRCVIVHCAWY